MTIEQLIALLQKEDPKARVMLACDAEGNEYSGLAELDVAYVEPDWDGERVEGVLFNEDFEDEDDEDESEYGEKSAYQKAVAFWPY